MRYLQAIAFQITAITSSALIAKALAPNTIILPHFLAKSLKATDITPSQLLFITALIATFNIIASALAACKTKSAPFTNARRAIIELLFVLSATSLASSCIFTFTLTPFNPNFYAWLYLLLTASHAIAFAIAHFTKRTSQAQPHPLRSLITPYTALACALISTPGALAILYKTTPDFANRINLTRSTFNLDTSTHWSLIDAYPNQTFPQPMRVRFSPNQPATFYLLARPGQLYRYTSTSHNTLDQTLVLDFTHLVGSTELELGALSFALHPQFAQPDSPNANYVYILYTHLTGDKQFNRLARFDLTNPDPTLAAQTEQRLFDIQRPATQMHNGGDILFDNHGMLCFSIGDHAVKNTQKINDTFSSGILRIDVDQRGGDISAPIKKQPRAGQSAHYFIPKDNPWFGAPDALEEFYAIGFRNPFRMSFDQQTGAFWVGDIGADTYEEHSRINKGDNAQWDFKEGPIETGFPKPKTIIGTERPPYYTYKQTALDRAAIGGFIYRGDRHPSLYNRYVFADNNSSVIRVIDSTTPSELQPTNLAKGALLGQQGVTSLTQTPDGHVLVTFLGSKTQNTGRLMILSQQTPPQTQLASIKQPSLDSVKTKYAMVCSRCHGDDGRGLPDIADAQSLAPRPDFTSPAWQAQSQDSYLHDVILKGGAALGKSPHMPAWQGFLSENETTLMIQLLRNYATTSSPATSIATVPTD